MIELPITLTVRRPGSVSAHRPHHWQPAVVRPPKEIMYDQKAQDAMHEWHQNPYDFSEKTKAKGQGEGNAIKPRLWRA
jgi:hypothetical protein